MDWNELFINIIKGVATVLATTIGAFVVMGLKQGFKWLKSKINSTVLKKIVDKIEDIVIEAVEATEQTIVDVAKAANSWDDVTKNEAFQNALDSVLATMNEKTKALITKEYGNIEKWLTNKIETYVRNMDNETTI